MYCLTRKTLKCNSLVQKICVSSKRDIHYKNSFSLGPQGPKQYIFGDHFYMKNARKLKFLLFRARKHMISSFWPNSQKVVSFFPRICDMFWVNLVAKNIVLGSLGIHFIDMRVNITHHQKAHNHIVKLSFTLKAIWVFYPNCKALQTRGAKTVR